MNAVSGSSTLKLASWARLAGFRMWATTAVWAYLIVIVDFISISVSLIGGRGSSVVGSALVGDVGVGSENTVSVVWERVHFSVYILDYTILNRTYLHTYIIYCVNIIKLEEFVCSANNLIWIFVLCYLLKSWEWTTIKFNLYRKL